MAETLPGDDMRVGFSELFFEIADVSECGIDLVGLRPGAVQLAAESMMVLCMALMDQPLSTKRFAR
jgi:hypothetical protein